jgi:protein pelota
MKILAKDKYVVKVQPEYLEDLWVLENIIDVGDMVKARTVRKIKKEGERKSDVSRKQMTLTLRVEKTELKSVLRISGKIMFGPEDIPKGSYHSLVIEPQTSLSITKEEWLSFQKERLQEATLTKPPSIIMVLFDREEALFAKLTRTGYDVLARIKGNVVQKRMKTKVKDDFYPLILQKLEEYAVRYASDKVIVASPAFWKDELIKVIKNNPLKKKMIFASCSSVTPQAIVEVLKRPETKTALAQDRFVKESRVVELLLTEIAKDGKVVYGFKNTKVAVEAGAVKKLIITDVLIKELREQQKYSSLDYVMRLVEQQKGTVMIISFTAGKKLQGLGGIAGFLRYKV